MDRTLSRIINLLKQDFPLIDDVKSRWFLIIFCAVFTTLFMIIYNPLNVIEYKINTLIGSMISVKSAGIVGALTLIITQFVLRPAFGIKTFSVLTFINWLIFEFFLISVILYIFYGERGRPLIGEFILTAENTFKLAIIPYSLSCVLIALYKLSSSRSREQKETYTVPAYISLRDENGKVKLTLKGADLLYLKSEDNYVLVTFLKNGIADKKLIRNNIKTLEKELNHPDILRVHRSYMINKKNINLINRHQGKLAVQMNNLPNSEIPVSSPYRNALESKIADLTS